LLAEVAWKCKTASVQLVTCRSQHDEERWLDTID